MNKSESIAKLATALSIAQSEMSGAKKKAVNPFFKSKYANLEDELKGLIRNAYNESKGQNFDKALSIYRSALAKAKCDRHRDSIEKKIAAIRDIKEEAEEVAFKNVPYVIGEKEIDAKRLIRGAGLVPSVTSDKKSPPNKNKENTVYSQDPRSNTTIKQGSRVRLYAYGNYVPPVEPIIKETIEKDERIVTGAWRLVSQTGPRIERKHDRVKLKFRDNKVYWNSESYGGDFNYYEAGIAFTWTGPPSFIRPGEKSLFISVKGEVTLTNPKGHTSARLGIGVDKIRGGILECFKDGERSGCEQFAWATATGKAHIVNGESYISLGNKDPDEFKVSLWITDTSSTTVMIREYTYRRDSRVPQEEVPSNSSYIRKIEVPYVIGLSFQDAKTRLIRSGLNAIPVDKGPSTSYEPYKVVNQKPSSGTKVDPGVQVKFYYFSQREAYMPYVIGYHREDALNELRKIGLDVNILDLGPSPSQADAYKVKEQWPAVNKTVRTGQKVTIKAYSGYVPTRGDLVGGLDCSVYPNTHSEWNYKTGQDECFCDNGYKWDTSGRSKGCIPISGGTIAKGDLFCREYISAIKKRLRSGNTAGLQSWAKTAKRMGCNDPVIEQVLSGGIVSGDGRGKKKLTPKTTPPIQPPPDEQSQKM